MRNLIITAILRVKIRTLQLQNTNVVLTALTALTAELGAFADNESLSN
jgi:hypothetical protein